MPRLALAWAVLSAEVCGSSLHERLSHGKLHGYPSFEEANQMLDEFVCAHPELLRREQAGQSFQKRPIHSFVLSAGGAPREGRPQVLVTSLMHPREMASLTVVLYFIGHVLELYKQRDPQAVYLLETRELWIVPFVNPDGYVENQRRGLFGNAGVRKNRRPTCRQANKGGVDINRNFAVKWEKNKFPACDEEYTGDAPFSEPEAQALKKLCDDNSFKTAINFHSFGDMLTHPWNYAPTLRQSRLPNEDDNAIYEEIQKVFKFAKFGPAIKTVRYTAIGESDDWMYGAKGIISMSPEVGPEEGGFAPRAELVQGIDSKNFDRIVFLAAKAGLELGASWARQAAGSWELRLRNSGLSNSFGATLSVAVAGLMNGNSSAEVKQKGDGSSLPSRLSVGGGEPILAFQAKPLPRRATTPLSVSLPSGDAPQGSQLSLCVLEAGSSTCRCLGPAAAPAVGKDSEAGAATLLHIGGGDADGMQRLCAEAARPWPGAAAAPTEHRKAERPAYCPLASSGKAGGSPAGGVGSLGAAASLRSSAAGGPGFGLQAVGAVVGAFALIVLLLLYIRSIRATATATDEERKPALPRGGANSKDAVAARPRVLGSPGPAGAGEA